MDHARLSHRTDWSANQIESMKWKKNERKKVFFILSPVVHRWRWRRLLKISRLIDHDRLNHRMDWSAIKSSRLSLLLSAKWLKRNEKSFVSGASRCRNAARRRWLMGSRSLAAFHLFVLSAGGHCLNFESIVKFFIIYIFLCWKCCSQKKASWSGKLICGHGR